MFLHTQQVHARQHSLRYLFVTDSLEDLALVLVASIPSRLLACLTLISNSYYTPGGVWKSYLATVPESLASSAL
jgi:hypothetical protein